MAPYYISLFLDFSRIVIKESSLSALACEKTWPWELSQSQEGDWEDI